MDAAEVEFLAEKELVTIIPNFSLDKIYLIGVRVRRAFASGTGACGRRLALLCSHVSGGKPGGGLGGSSPRALRGRGWGEVRSRETWAGEPLEVARASQVFLGGLPGAPRNRAQVGRQVRRPHPARADVGCRPRRVTTGRAFVSGGPGGPELGLALPGLLPPAGRPGALQPGPAGASAAVAGD